MHIDYLNPAIRQLRDQQVRFAPREKKVEQVSQAEKLLRELDPKRTYTYEYLCFRITNYRPESYPDLKLSGLEAGHDLRLFVEDVSESASIPAENAGERVVTVDSLAKEFNVSTENHLALAAAWAGQSPLRDGRPQARRFSLELGGKIRRAES